MTPADRTRLAYRVHDAAWGYKRRPLGWRARLQWRTVASFWVRRCRLTCDDVVRIAEALGGSSGKPLDDDGLRQAFVDRLRGEAMARRPMSDARRKRGRVIALVKLALRADPRFRD